MGPAVTPPATLHVRPPEGEAHEVLGYERVLWAMRLLGILVVVSQVPLYRVTHPALVPLAILPLLAMTLLQSRWLHAGLSVERIRRRAVLGLAADVVAVYTVGFAFAADPEWVGFYFYPLVALEATIVAGSWAGAAVTGANVAVYLLQLALHASLGQPVEPRSTLAAIALLGISGGFLAAFGAISDRGRRDLRMLLDLTAALANQQVETETIELLDRRLSHGVGGRVRSIALRVPDGSYEIVRWHSDERRILSREAVERTLGPADRLEAQFESGRAITYPVEGGSTVGEGLGLPEWTASVTLIPIFVEGRWVGILPVLWRTPHTPSDHQLRLLYGLASQVGLAVSQGQLQRVREEAATDPLTGLLNRRAILDDLSVYLSRAARGSGRLAVLFCDLDSFKAVNDRRGHEAGDAVLRAVAASVRRAVRAGDVVGRYGGDELLVIAADADEDDALELAARVGAAVRLAAAEDGVDVTIGIATYPDDGATELELVAAADRAMYRGKVGGPGRATLAGDGPGVTLAAG